MDDGRALSGGDGQEMSDEAGRVTRSRAGQVRNDELRQLGRGERQGREKLPGDRREPSGQGEVPESNRVVLRDVIIFQVKLFLDGLGDLVLAPLSLAAFAWDLISRGPSGRTFYRVLRLGERWDLWLNLYRPARVAGSRGEGLLGAVTDADTFLGSVEELIKERRWPGGPDTDGNASELEAREG